MGSAREWYVFGTRQPQVVAGELAEEVRFEHPPSFSFQCIQLDTKEATVRKANMERSTVRLRYTGAGERGLKAL